MLRVRQVRWGVGRFQVAPSLKRPHGARFNPDDLRREQDERTLCAVCPGFCLQVQHLLAALDQTADHPIEGTTLQDFLTLAWEGAGMHHR